MPDITMCTGEGCKKKETCYRFKATPSQYRQSFFVAAPVENGKCEHYWKDDSPKITANKTKDSPVTD